MISKSKGNIIDKDRYDIIVFIQAPADLRYALSIYEKNKEKDVLLCVVNVKSIFRYLCDLSIPNVSVFFIKPIFYSLKKPLSISKARKEFRALLSVFNSILFDEIYFFSRIDDWVTCGLIGNLSNKGKNIFYRKHYDDFGLSKISKKTLYYWKAQIHSKIASFLTGVDFISRFYGKPLEFCFWKYSIMEEKQNDNILIDQKYFYEIKKIENKKNILFFLTPEDLDFITENTKAHLLNVLSRLKTNSDYNLCLKGHPRIGTPEELFPYFDFVLPNYIPSEFIDYTKFLIVIGVGTAALAYPIKLGIGIKVFSIVNDLEFKNINNKIGYRKYLNELTSNQIKYASLEDIEKLLSNE